MNSSMIDVTYNNKILICVVQKLKELIRTCYMHVLGAIGRMRDDIASIEQSEQKVKKVAKHYADKYKEANEVLELRNIEKATLLQEKEKLEKTKSALEQ